LPVAKTVPKGFYGINITVLGIRRLCTKLKDLEKIALAIFLPIILGGVAGVSPAEGGGTQRSASQGGDFPPLNIYLLRKKRMSERKLVITIPNQNCRQLLCGKFFFEGGGVV